MIFDRNKLILDNIMNPDVITTITICGSAKFRHIKEKYQAYYTLKGNIVHMPVNFSLIEKEMNTTKDMIEYNHKILDKIHREKIMRSDVVLVVNTNYYVGEDTCKEIIFAYNNKKPVIYTDVKDGDVFIFNNDKTYPLYIWD